MKRCYGDGVNSTESQGARIARYRHRSGISQTKLAQLAHASRSMIAQIEGDKASPSASMLGAIANALEVDIERLKGTRPDDPEILHELVATVRRALAATDLVVDSVEPRPLPEIRADIVQLGEWRRATKYAKIGAVLPDLIDELLVATGVSGEDAYAMLTGAYRAANTLGHKLGYSDLSLTAVERAEWAAGRAGDPLLIAMTHYLRAAALARIGAGPQAMVLLDRTITEVQPLAEPGNSIAAAVYSALHMKAGTIAASLSRRDASQAHLDEAATFAGTADRIVHETVVGPVNVKLHRLAAAVDLGDLGKAAQIASDIELPTGYAKERTAYFWVDSARAHLGRGEIDLAIEALYEAHDAAPEHFRSSTIRNTINTVAAQERRASHGVGKLVDLAGMNGE